MIGLFGFFCNRLVGGNFFIFCWRILSDIYFFEDFVYLEGEIRGR